MHYAVGDAPGPAAYPPGYAAAPPAAGWAYAQMPPQYPYPFVQPPAFAPRLIPPLERPHAALPPVSVQQPALLTTFSYDTAKRRLHDDSAKRWFREPPVGADLNYGFERYVEEPHVPDPLDSVLYTLMERAGGALDRTAVAGTPSISPAAVAAELLRMQVVTWRGIMTKLCTAWSLQTDGPPQFRDGFELNAMMLGDTLVLEEAPPPVPPPVPPPGSRKLRSAYYGRSFESYCTSESPDAPTGWAGVDNNVQWCHIVKTRLGDTRIVLGGEVDCVERAADGSEGVVELKTSAQPGTPRDEAALRAKMLRMYMQSFLLGVRTLVLGLRDVQGTLVGAQRLRTTDIPRVVRGHAGEWSAHENLAFGAQMLEYLRHVVARHTEGWLLHACGGLVGRDGYEWRVHRGSGSFLCHLPLPAVHEAEYEYPVFRVSFVPPFSHVTVRPVSRAELACDGRRAGRIGIVPTRFYEWVTERLYVQ